MESQKHSGRTSHAYVGWTEGNSVSYVLKFIFLGEGGTALAQRRADSRAVAASVRASRYFTMTAAAR